MTGEAPAAKVVIVGAGPAGIRAAQVIVSGGLRPVVIDEGVQAGGQIYRRQPSGFTRTPETLYGSQALKAGRLHACFDRMTAENRIDYRPQSSVVAIANSEVHVLGPQGIDRVPYDRLILATGASDRVLPVSGWQAAGVYTLGAAQIALKSQAVALGRAMVLAGTGPLLTLVATQLLKAGANVVAVLDTSSPTRQLRGIGGLAARPVFALSGLAMRARLFGKYHAGVRLAGIEAGSGGVTSVSWLGRNDRQYSVECDCVALGWHLRAETHLADLAGCAFDYDDVWKQWLPRTDRFGRAGNCVYVAGDGARILGADGAEVAGRLAGAACLADLGLPAPPTSRYLWQRRRLETFASGVAKSFPWPANAACATPDDTVVCRCEGVRAGVLREAVRQAGPEVNRTKALSRVGMGRCQGRYCQLAAAEIVAAEAGMSTSGVGRLRAQAPARPIPIAAFLADS